MASKKDKIRAQAQKFLQKGLIEKAIREYERLIQEDPNDIRTLLKVGDLNARQRNVATAVATYKRVAESYSTQGFFLKSVAIYKQILKLNPGALEIHEHLGELYEQLGLTTDASKEYDLLCSHYEGSKQNSQFQKYLERFVKLCPQHIERQIQLADSYKQCGMLAESRQALSCAAAQLEIEERYEEFIDLSHRVLESDPSDLRTAQSLGQAYIKTNQPKKALSVLQTCLNAEPRNILVLGLLADAFKQLDKPDKALIVYRELEKILTHREDFQARNQVLESILELTPKDELANTNLNQASSFVSAPIKPRGSSPDSQSISPGKLLQEANIYFKYAYYNKALSRLTTLLSANPFHRDARIKQRDIFLIQGDIPKAVQTLWSMAKTSAENGHLQQARDDLDELLGFDPTFQQARNYLQEILQHPVTALPKSVAHQSALSSEAPNSTSSEDDFEIVFVDPETDKPQEGFDNFEIDWQMEESLLPETFEKVVAPQVVEASDKLEIDIDFNDSPEEVKDEFAEVLFFIQQDLLEDATTLIEQLKQDFPENSRVSQLEEYLAQAYRQVSDDHAQLVQSLALDTFEVVDNLSQFDTTAAKESVENNEAPVQLAHGLHAAQIKSTDYETHYELGIAYKEMGLFNEAAREFNLSIKSPEFAFDSLMMLGQCALENGNEEESLAHFLKAIDIPTNSPTQAASLRYEIGHHYLRLEDYSQAHRYFTSAATLDAQFRDVQALITKTKAKIHSSPTNQNTQEPL